MTEQLPLVIGVTQFSRVLRTDKFDTGNKQSGHQREKLEKREGFETV